MNAGFLDKGAEALRLVRGVWAAGARHVGAWRAGGALLGLPFRRIDSGKLGVERVCIAADQADEVLLLVGA